MSNLQMWSLIVGFLTPLLTAAVQQPKWTSRTRALVQVAVAIVIGAGTAWFNDQIDSTKGVTTAILVVLVASMSSYESVWKKTGATAKIEQATSPGTVVAEVMQTEKVAVPAVSPANAPVGDPGE